MRTLTVAGALMCMYMQSLTSMGILYAGAYFQDDSELWQVERVRPLKRSDRG